MNLRISEQELRFRVSKQELSQLCEGKRLIQKVHLSGLKMIIFSIEIHKKLGMNLSHTENEIILQIDKQSAIAFYDSLPSREGRRFEQDIDYNKTLTIFLEVDIRTQKRKRD